MKFDEDLFWKIVCLVLVVACLRTNTVGFILCNVVVYYALLHVPHESVIRERPNTVSARAAHEVPATKGDQDKTPNWRKTTLPQQPEQQPPRRPSSVRQPTSEQWKRLRKTLYDEMMASATSRGRT